jgi:predicted small lipoprotein YifL
MKFHAMLKHYRPFGLLLAVIIPLTACGQYGDLYLPEKQPSARSADAPQPDDTQQPGD